MAGTVQLDGALLAQPACGDGSFPSGITNIPLSLLPCAKGYNVTTGDQVAAVAAVAYAALGGIGAGGPVTNAHTLMLRSTTPMQVRLTRADSSQAVEFVQGLLVVEATPGKEVTLVEVIGSGSLEYAAFGNT